MLKRILDDDRGSIAPLISFLLLIIILGLAFGVASAILSPLVTTTLSIDWLMFNMFLAAPVFVLFISGSWLLVKAQRSQ